MIIVLLVWIRKHFLTALKVGTCWTPLYLSQGITVYGKHHYYVVSRSKIRPRSFDLNANVCPVIRVCVWIWQSTQQRNLRSTLLFLPWSNTILSFGLKNILMNWFHIQNEIVGLASGSNNPRSRISRYSMSLHQHRTQSVPHYSFGPRDCFYTG